MAFLIILLFLLVGCVSHPTPPAERPVETATGKDLGKAKEVLIEKLPSAEFFGEWEKKLKGWVPLCVSL